MAGETDPNEAEGEEDDSTVEQLPRKPTDSQIFQSITNAAKFIATQRERPLLYLFYPSMGMISSNHSVHLYDLFQRRGEVEELDVVLHSTGGDLHEAYDIIKLCRSYTEGEVTVFVPMRAMSAATLIALGADKVILSEIGKLGPLDPQIPHPETGRYMPVRSVTEIPEVLEKGLATSETDVPVEIKGESIIKPIAEQVDPYYLTEHEKTADLAREYGQKLLSQRDIDETLAERCLDYLIEYPTHSYSVDLPEINSTPDLSSVINAQRLQDIDEGNEIEQDLIMMLSLFLHFDQKYILRGEPRAEPKIKIVDPVDDAQQLLSDVSQELPDDMDIEDIPDDLDIEDIIDEENQENEEESDSESDDNSSQSESNET